MPRRVLGAQPSCERESKQSGSCPLLSAASAAGDICEPRKPLALSTTENRSMWVDKHTHTHARIYVQGHYFTEAAGHEENPVNFSAFLLQLFGL